MNSKVTNFPEVPVAKQPFLLICLVVGKLKEKKKQKQV